MAPLSTSPDISAVGHTRFASRLVDLRCRVGTNIGRVGDAWDDGDGEHISVVYEDEQLLAIDVPPAEFVVGRTPARYGPVLR